MIDGGKSRVECPHLGPSAFAAIREALGEVLMGAANASNQNSDNRREPRSTTHNAITFSHLNKKEKYIGIVRDFSRSGMFFFSTRKLKPGNCIVILPLVCQATDLLWGDGECGAVAAAVCSAAEDHRHSTPHPINMVTAKVTRCEALEDANRLRFGIAVDYIRPTI